MKKYYVEVWNRENENGYVMQSKWYDTEEEAIGFAHQIEYLEFGYFRDIMSAEFDGEEMIGDIEVETHID